MGLAASQVRFLQLTSRKSDIGRELQHLSNQKMALTRDMHQVSKDYQAAINSKTMMWSSNGGVSYVDISYNGLMRPNAYNAKSPILISDSAGKIVLDQKYKKYAEMLDEAGGKWSGDIRNQILAGLTGISAEDIQTAKTTAEAANKAADKYNDAQEDLDKWLADEEKKGGTKFVTIKKLAEKLGSVNGKDLSTLYKQGASGNYSIKSAADLHSLADGIYSNMSKYFLNDDTFLNIQDKTAFKEGCDAFVTLYSALLTETGANGDKNREAAGLKGSTNNWTIDISKVLDAIMGGYVINGSYDYNSQDEKTYALRDTSSSSWQSWYEGVKTRQAALDAAKAEYDKAVDVAGQVMTAEQETNLEYYDLLFQAIADNGWVYDAQIGEDSEYLNEMFQNNQYYVTTIEKNACYDSSKPKNGSNWEFLYNTSPANNFTNIYSVNDTDARNEALVEYEYKKSIISSKESRIDTRMKNLETEQSAITKMLESIDQTKSDNIERTFGIWG